MRERAKRLDGDPARREQVFVSGLDVAVPEDVTEPQTAGEVEHDAHVGAPLVKRRGRGRAELDACLRRVRERVAHLERRRLQPARGRQQHVGEAAGRGVGQLDLGEERQLLERPVGAAEYAELAYPQGTCEKLGTATNFAIGERWRSK